MDRFTRTDLQELIDIRDVPCVSLYLPTHPAGQEKRQEPIRCKNLIAEAEVKLLELELRRPDVRAILAPLEDLHADQFFWTHQSEGLAMFAAPDWFRYFRLPLPLPELSLVGQRFHVRPLLPVLEGDGLFYLLAVSSNSVRLFQGTRFSIGPVATELLPTNLVKALNIDEFFDSLQMRSFLAGGPGAKQGGNAVWHGQGGAGLDIKKKDELLEFFHLIDDGLQEFFGEENAPLVFAGVEYLFPIFAETISYRNLLDQPVTGNPDELSGDELHDRAWSIVEPHFQVAKRDALDRYGTLLGHHLASHDLQTVVVGARRSGVDTLFVARDAHCWGVVDEATDQIVVRAEPNGGVEDLLDHATVQTLLHGGTVYTVEPENLHPVLGAIFRYPLGTAADPL